MRKCIKKGGSVAMVPNGDNPLDQGRTCTCGKPKTNSAQISILDQIAEAR